MPDSRIEGAGLGLRSQHLPYIFERSPNVPWFEVLVNNYFNRGTVPHRALEKIRTQFPIVFHGVGMNLGSHDPLNDAYLDRLSELIDQYQPEWVSDHLCWIGVGGLHSHDLLPLPFTQEAVKHLADRIQTVQERLKRRILVENLSGYVRFVESEMTEWDFIKSIAETADCDFLLDVNNVYVNASNLRFNPYNYIDSIPASRVKQIHLAGHLDVERFLVDDHGSSVRDEVWDLYRHAIGKWGAVPTLIEWDMKIPEFPVLLNEAQKAKAILEGCYAAQ